MQKNDSNNRMQFQFVAVLDDSVRGWERKLNLNEEIFVMNSIVMYSAKIVKRTTYWEKPIKV